MSIDEKAELASVVFTADAVRVNLDPVPAVGYEAVAWWVDRPDCVYRADGQDAIHAYVAVYEAMYPDGQ